MYMNILLWVLQILLALWNITGGLYMVNHYQQLADRWALIAFPKPVWMAFGALQVLFAFGLLLPGVIGALRKLTSVSSAGLAVISLLGIALYIAYAGFPGMLWGVIPAILASFVAYGRWPAKS